MGIYINSSKESIITSTGDEITQLLREKNLDVVTETTGCIEDALSHAAICIFNRKYIDDSFDSIDILLRESVVADHNNTFQIVLCQEKHKKKMKEVCNKLGIRYALGITSINQLELMLTNKDFIEDINEKENDIKLHQDIKSKNKSRERFSMKTMKRWREVVENSSLYSEGIDAIK